MHVYQWHSKLKKKKVKVDIFNWHTRNQAKKKASEIPNMTLVQELFVYV